MTLISEKMAGKTLLLDNDFQDLARKTAFGERERIYKNDYTDLIWSFAAKKYFESKRTLNKIKKFATTEDNPLQVIVDALSISYVLPVMRRLRGVPDEQAALWSDIVKKSEIESEATTFERWATAVNVVFIIPVASKSRVYGERIRYELVLPRYVNLTFTEDGEIDLFFYQTSSKKYNLVGVDSEAFYYFKDKMLVDLKPHGLGVSPVVQWRVDRTDPGDFFSVKVGQDLAECTYTCSIINILRRYNRSVNYHKIVTAHFPDAESVKEGQDRGPENILTTVGNGPQNTTSPSWNVLDTTVPIKEALDDRNDLVARCFERRGLDASELFKDDSGSTASNVFANALVKQGDRIVQFRNRRIQYLKRCEKELAYITALVANKQLGIPIDPELVKNSFEVEFPPMTMVGSESERLRVGFEKLKAGIWDYAQFLQSFFPELTYEEASARTIANFNAQADVWELQAARFLSADPTTRTGALAALYGQLGGRPPKAEGDAAPPEQITNEE